MSTTVATRIALVAAIGSLSSGLLMTSAAGGSPFSGRAAPVASHVRADQLATFRAAMVRCPTPAQR